MTEDNKLRKEKRINFLIWVVICIISIFTQFLFIFFGLFLSLSGVVSDLPVETLYRTIKVIPYVLILSIPILVQLMFAVLTYKKQKQYIFVAILSLILAVSFIDFNMYYMGCISIYSNVESTIQKILIKRS